MMSARIALIGYPAEYFISFARALQQVGFEVFWVCALTADARYLRNQGVPKSRILDINEGFQLTGRYQECKDALVAFENETDPKFNDIILMDRLLKRKDWQFSVELLRHVATAVSAFVERNGLQIMSSYRDTAIQMTAMLVARRHAIPFIVPTRIRIPQEMYGFCTAHHTDSFVTLRPTTQEDNDWAESFLATFERGDLKPALKKSSRSFVDVLRLMPSHARAFLYEVRRSSADSGNDFTRYPLWRLVTMYLRRRINLFLYQFVRPAEASLSPALPYCLYALHTQPESSIDVQGSYFSDQIELIRHIARSLPASHVLYVKVHPTDVDGQSTEFYRRIKAIPSVVLVDFSVDSRMLQKSASIIFALTGTMAYEAGLLQKPVIVFARNYFNALPTIHHCTDPTALPALVRRILMESKSPSAEGRRQVLLFMARMRAACFEGEVARNYGESNEPLRATDLQVVQKAYLTLWQALTKDHDF
jgi:hypothetical protein